MCSLEAVKPCSHNVLASSEFFFECTLCSGLNRTYRHGHFVRGHDFVVVVVVVVVVVAEI